LAKPNFEKDFIILTNSTEEVISAILLRKDDHNSEQPIAYMSQSLSDDEFKYTLIEKHTFSLVKTIEKFCHFILGKHTQVKVPLPAVNFFLSQTHLSRKLAHWLAKIQEHDFTITTSNAIKGRDLALPLTQHPEPGYSSENNEDTLSTLFPIGYGNLDLAAHPWYRDIIYYLRYERCPDNLKHHERRTRLEASKYLILNTSLFRRTVDGLLLRCVDDTAAQMILKKIHGSTNFDIHISGHFAAKDIAHKILRIGYYWSSVFRDSYKFVQACVECQNFVDREKFSSMPLQPVLLYFPFSKWGLDFIEPIVPSSSTCHIFILTATDYFTKWTEAIPLKHAQDEQIISFLEFQNIFSRFGLPIEIISNNGHAFISRKLTQFLNKFEVKHFTSSTYYP
jgi:hypothetical protein